MNDQKEWYILAFLFLCLTFVCCNKNEEMFYSPKVIKNDGVTHIINPHVALSHLREFVLKEELSIGNVDDNSNSIFGIVRDIGVDAQGNIYVLDRRHCHIKKFNPQGTYLRTVGRRGQGPGEFLFPLDLVVDKKNKMIHILDFKNNKISRYHLDGKLDDDIKLKEGIPDQLFMISGKHYLVLYDFYDDQGNQKYRCVKYGLDGEMLLQSGEFLAYKEKIIQKGNLTISGGSPFDAARYFACDSEKSLYTGFSDKFEIVEFDTNFNKIKVIQKNKPELIKVTQQEIDNYLNKFKERQKKRGRPYTQILKLIHFPQYHPVFTGMWITDKNRLLVRTPSKDGKVHLDVFDHEGIYIEKMYIDELFDGTSMDDVFRQDALFIGNHIYTWIKDKNDEWVIKKYSIIEK